MGLAVLLVGLHLLRQLLFGHFDEVVVLLDGLLDHLPLVLPLLRQMLQQLSLLILHGQSGHDGHVDHGFLNPPGQNHPFKLRNVPRSGCALLRTPSAWLHDPMARPHTAVMRTSHQTYLPPLLRRLQLLLDLLQGWVTPPGQGGVELGDAIKRRGLQDDLEGLPRGALVELDDFHVGDDAPGEVYRVCWERGTG